MRLESKLIEKVASMNLYQAMLRIFFFQIAMVNSFMPSSKVSDWGYGLLLLLWEVILLLWGYGLLLILSD